MPANWMRVVTYRSIARSDPGAADYLESTAKHTLQRLEQQSGFQGGYWSRDYGTEELAAVTYWDSLDAINDADPVFDALHAEREQHGIRVVSARNMQVLDAHLPA
jgi:heme-degrading monooxygenase HmoA